MKMIETERVRIIPLTSASTENIYRLYTDPLFIKHVGDKGIKNQQDADTYLHNSLLKHYQKNGFGLWAVYLKQSNEFTGICGLVQRDSLYHPDVGFGFLTRFHGLGLATESAQAVLAYAIDVLNFEQVLGITSEENKASQHVLNKIGLHRRENLVMPEYGKQPVVMYARMKSAIQLKKTERISSKP